MTVVSDSCGATKYGYSGRGTGPDRLWLSIYLQKYLLGYFWEIFEQSRTQATFHCQRPHDVLTRTAEQHRAPTLARRPLCGVHA